MKKCIFAAAVMAAGIVSAAWTPYQLGLCGKVEIPWCDDVYGLKAGLVGHTTAMVYGLDVEPGAGRAREMVGLGLNGVGGVYDICYGIHAVGACAWDDAMYGIQVGGLCARAKNAVGLQIADVFTINETFVGWQISCFNVGGTVEGFQLGLVNSAQKLEGIQLGVINYNGNSALYSTLPVFNFGW